MVSISYERPVATERRLLEVLRAADVVHLDGSWSFVRFGNHVPAAAVAAVRDDEGWCALVPGEDFALTRTTFSPAIENSGFVGWLATTIKRRLGSGVFVVCGDNPARGGIFDYLGYPVKVADAVRGLIDDLRAWESGELDLRVFDVVETSAASAISNETRFEFREHDGVVEASYEGGGIVRGFLTGRRDGDRVATAYSQLLADGALRTGTAELRLERTGARLRLIEEYTWSDGGRGSNVLESDGR